MPRAARNPEGIRVRAAAQPHGGCTAIAVLLVVDDVTASSPPRALRPNAPCARPLLILGQAPSGSQSGSQSLPDFQLAMKSRF
jgi:hypothetical protein